MSKRANRVGLASSQVDVYGRIRLARKQLTQIIASLPRWTDFNVFKNGTEQILPVNGSDPSVQFTSPIIADINYPDGRRNVQSFLYRESPTEKDGRAWIRNIKGNTVSFNQFCRKASVYSSTYNGVTINVYDDGSFKLDGTVTEDFWASSVFGNNMPSVDNGHTDHKVYFVFRSTHSFSGRQLGIRQQGYLIENNNSFLINSFPSFTGTNSLQIEFKYGDVFNNDYVWPQFFDLTLMGVDNLTTAAEIEAWLFSHLGNFKYFNYTSGMLIPFNGTELKTTGKNLIPDGTNTSNGYVSGMILKSDGTTQENIYYNISEYFSIIAGQTYSYCSYPNTSGGIISFCFYDVNKTYISGGSIDNGHKVLIAPIGSAYCRACISDSSNTAYKILVCSGNAKPNEYEPYVSNTLSLPTLTYFETGMKSAGEAYDEIDPESNKVITRVGSVDLGTLDYVYYNGYLICTGLTNVIKKPASNNDVANVKCGLYKTVPSNGVVDADKQIAVQTSGSAIIYDTAYTDASTFKNAMQGVMLYFEMETPTEEPIIELD